MNKLWDFIKWIRNAPTGITATTETLYCDYCGREDGGIWNYDGVLIKFARNVERKHTIKC